MDAAELCFTPATELIGMIRSRKISPVELTQVVLDRIQAIDPKIRAYITVIPELALQTAREREKELMGKDPLGPLHGIPISIKDLTPTRGIRTTWGCRHYKDFVPEEDALVVQRIKKAGAILLGKTNTPEFGIGINATNGILGTTLNPWDRSKTAGGSSGGAAAALAAGLGPLAEGTDMAGSIRLPASYCGIVGLRPSPGVIPRYPNYWAWDTMAVHGPMARTTSDLALLLSVMAGPDERDPIAPPLLGPSFPEEIHRDLRGMRMAWTPDLKGLCRIEPEVARICQEAARKFEEIGCRVEEDSPDLGLVRAIIPPLRAFWTAAARAQLLEIEDEVDNSFLKDYLHKAHRVTAMEVALAERARTRLWLSMGEFFQRYDFLLTPTTSTPAFAADRLFPAQIDGRPVEDRIDSYLHTYALSFTGLPAISVPAGWTQAGLPVGLQIIGRKWAEGMVIRAAANLERIAPWAHRRPPE
jgi:amidase